MPRTFALAALLLCTAASPAFAATTAQQKFEKLVARYAQPSGSEDFTKARGLCSCISTDAAVQGRAGVLVYAVEAGMAVNVVKVGCSVPVFDPSGAVGAGSICESWTLLSR